MYKLLKPTEVDRQMDDTAVPVPEALRDLLGEAVRQLHSVEHYLYRSCNEVTRTVLRVGQQIGRGLHINELGELQRASEFNRLCALREERANYVKAIQHAINESYGTKVDAWTMEEVAK